MNITVWIDEGCICCQACVQAAPEVFTFPDGAAEILGHARVDGVTSANRKEQSPLRPADLSIAQDTIIEAAEGCPADVIRYRVAAS